MSLGYSSIIIGILGILVSFETLARLAKKLFSKHFPEYYDEQSKIIDNLLKYIRSIAIIIITYIVTSNIYLLLPLQKQISDALFILVVILTADLLSNVFKEIFKIAFEDRLHERVPKIIYGIVKGFVYFIAILIILDRLNIAISPLLATLGIGGLAIGLALQPTLSNFFAGLYLLSERQINVGDFIEIDGEIAGFVEDIGWRATKIRTLYDTIVIIPNSKLAESKIINNSLPTPETIVRVYCGVSYNSDLEKVEKILEEIGRYIKEKYRAIVDPNYGPVIRFYEFGDSNINFYIALKVRNPSKKYDLIHITIKEIKKRFDNEGIEISWPVSKIYFGNDLSVRKDI